MSHAALCRTYFFNEQATRLKFREEMNGASSPARFVAWLEAIAEDYTQAGNHAAGTCYAAALSELKVPLPALHAELVCNTTTQAVLQHCVSQKSWLHHLDILDQLIKAGVSVHLKLDDEEFTALHWAGTPVMTKAVLGYGADLEAQGLAKATPLLHAVLAKDVDKARTLLQYGSDVEATLASGMDVLMASIAAKLPVDFLDEVIERGVEIDKHRQNGETPILVAAHKNHAEAIAYLVGKGASPNVRERAHGQSALWIAVHHGCGNAVRALLEGGANPQELKSVALEQYLAPEEVRFVRAFLTESAIFDGIGVPKRMESVHNEDTVDDCATKSSVLKLSPL